MLISELLAITKISASELYKYLGHKKIAMDIAIKLDLYKKTRENHYLLPHELLAIHDHIPLYGNAIAIVRKELAKMKAWYERGARPDAVIRPEEDIQDWVVYEQEPNA